MYFVTAVCGPLTGPSGLRDFDISPVDESNDAVQRRSLILHTLCIVPCAQRDETLLPCFQSRSELAIEELQRMIKNLR
jgi:hypothetical protein